MICCDAFDPNAYITTELGETYFAGAKGYVENASMSPDCGIKLKLLYGEPENENTGFNYGKGMVITEVKTTAPDRTTYTAVLTQPADADLQIKIRLVIQDSTLIAFCTTAWFDLDIATGFSTGSVVVPWCDPGTPPLRIYVHHWDDTGLGTWDWTFIPDPDAYTF